MNVTLRHPTAADADACGRIMYEAFAGIADQHAFPRDFPSVEVATQLATAFITEPSVFGVVAEKDGKVVGSNFLSEGDPIRGVGPITVDPSVQGTGAGRRLMQSVIERGQEAAGVRLVQDAFNTRSYSLYASLGFDVKEPLLLMRGTPRGKPNSRANVRPMAEDDVTACARLCTAVHGYARSHELRDALRLFSPFVIERDGRITGYLTAATFWLMNHGVADTEEDIRALILGAGAMRSEPLSFLLPTRQASFFRWCLSEGLRAIKPMTLMAMGRYQEPKGCYFPSVLY
jgi:predicted N-acetyltransferase YhbS